MGALNGSKPHGAKAPWEEWDGKARQGREITKEGRITTGNIKGEGGRRRKEITRTICQR